MIPVLGTLCLLLVTSQDPVRGGTSLGNSTFWIKCTAKYLYFTIWTVSGCFCHLCLPTALLGRLGFKVVFSDNCWVLIDIHV